MARRRQDAYASWEPVLDLCRRTGTIMTCLIIGLLGGAAFVAFLVMLPEPPAPLTANDVVPLVCGALLFATFLPLSIALGIGRAILEWAATDEG
jgi:hypothetical protein